MSDNNVVNLFLSNRKRHRLSDREKVVQAYHAFYDQKVDLGKELLSSVTPQYYLTQLHKDIARALLCWISYRSTQSEEHRKESEFYLIVYRITKYLNESNISFNKSSYFTELQDTLFKDFQL